MRKFVLVALVSIVAYTALGFSKFTSPSTSGMDAAAVRDSVGAVASDSGWINIAAARDAAGDSAQAVLTTATTRIRDSVLVRTATPIAIADSTARGVVGFVIANGTLAAGDGVYLNTSSKAVGTDANTSGPSQFYGIVTKAAAANDTVAILHAGYYRNDARYNWGTVGGPLWLSAAAVGALTQTAPSGSGDQLVPVGYAYDANTVFIFARAWVEAP